MASKQTSLGYWARTAAIVGTLVAGVALYQGIVSLRENYALMINATDSLPNWAFIVTKGNSPRRGDYLVFAPPRTELVVRHFTKRPRPFIKIVYGVAGDFVTHNGNVVAVYGQAVAKLKPFSILGERLTPGPIGEVPKGCYYAGTPHKDGFDSRYAAIGFICQHSVLGTGRPIL